MPSRPGIPLRYERSIMRFVEKKAIVALILVAGLAFCNSSSAEEPQKLDPQVQALIQRLEAAEQQIQSLTVELSKVKEKQTIARPFPETSKEPSQIPVPAGTLPLEVEGVFRSEQSEFGLETESVRQPNVEQAFVPAVGREELAAFEEAITTSDNVDQRLSALENGWKELDEAWNSFDSAQKKKKADAAKKPTFQIGGRIHADYWDFVNSSQGINHFEHPEMLLPNYGDPPEDRALFRRIRLEMKGDILETMLWRVQVDFNNPSLAEIKDVYFGFKELPLNQQLLIGNQKRPLGLDHLNSSRFNVFMERPFVVEAFNEDARRPGIAMYGHTDDESLNWRYGAYMLESVARTGRVIGQSSQMSLNARVSGSPWYDEASGGRGYFHWGLSGMYARPDGDRIDSDTNFNEARFRTRAATRSDRRWLNTDRIAGAENYEIIGLESIFNVGPFQAVGEYQHTWLQRETGEDLQFGGAYFYLSYFLTGEHIPYTRTSGTLGRVKPFENFFLVDNCYGGHSTGWGAWNVAVRYDYLDLTDHDILGGIGSAWTTALNWHWTPYSKVQFDASYGKIKDHEPVGGYSGGHYFLLGTRFAVDF